MKQQYTYEWPKADITVDCVLFGLTPDWRLEVVLIRRAEDPFKGRWALPGGFIEFLKGETSYEAARREMQEETGIEVAYLEQLGTFDAPDRDPRGRTFSVAHYALVRTQDHKPEAGSDASRAEWVSVWDALSFGKDSVAFDHSLILRTAVARLQAKIRYAPVGFNLLPETFTLEQLRKVYQAILGSAIDPSNFRKKLRILNKKANFLEQAGTIKEQRTGAAARLYRFNKEAYDNATLRGINFEL